MPFGEAVGDFEEVEEILGDADGDLEVVIERDEVVEPDIVKVLVCDEEMRGDFDEVDETLSHFVARGEAESTTDTFVVGDIDIDIFPVNVVEDDPLSDTELDALTEAVTVLRLEGVGRVDLVLVLDAVTHVVGAREPEILVDGVTDFVTGEDRVVDGDAEIDVVPVLVREFEFDPVGVFVPVCDFDVVVVADWLRETADAVTVGLTRIVAETLEETLTVIEAVDEVEKVNVGDIEIERRVLLVNDALPESDLDMKMVADKRALAVDDFDGNTDGVVEVDGVEALEGVDETLTFEESDGTIVPRLVTVPIRETAFVFETPAVLVVDDDTLGDGENDAVCELERDMIGDLEARGEGEKATLTEAERETLGDAVITIVAVFVLEVDALPETVLVPEEEAVIVLDISGDFVVLDDGLKVGEDVEEDERFPD